MQIYKLHVLLAKIPVLEFCNFIINRLLHRCFPVIWKFYTSRQLFKSVSIRGNTTKYHYKKVSVFRVFLVRIFPHADWIRATKTLNMDTFHVDDVNSVLYPKNLWKYALKWNILFKRDTFPIKFGRPASCFHAKRI